MSKYFILLMVFAVWTLIVHSLAYRLGCADTERNYQDYDDYNQFTEEQEKIEEEINK